MNLAQLDPRQLLQLTWQGPSLRAWLIALAVVVGGFVLLMLARRLTVGRLVKVSRRTSNTVDDLAAVLVQRTRWYFLLALLMGATARFLPLALSVQSAIGTGLKVASLFQIGVWGGAIMLHLLKRSVERRRSLNETGSIAMLTALTYAGRFFLWLILIVAVLSVYDVNVTGFVTGLGISGIAVALAVQNILGDLFAAISIVFDKPFVVGDSIAVDNYQGTVEQIGLKTTRLRSVNGEQIIFANAELLKSRIRNYKRQYERRVMLHVDVSYDTPPDRLATIPAMIERIVAAQSPVRFDRCHLAAYTERALRFETVYWVLDPDYRRHMDIQQTVLLAILERCHAHEISIATPSPSTVVVSGDGQKVPSQQRA
jgi:small-conductance mechanosensitive channel